LAACKQLDTVLPSRGSYRVNALVNFSSLDECSVIAVEDTVLPYFSSSVAGDPDLTSLVVYLEDSGGKPVGNRVRYTIETLSGPPETDPVEAESPLKTDETEVQTRIIEAAPSPRDLVIPVDSFTGQLPPFPMAGNLEIGRYTMVFEIRGKHDLLNRARRPIYYTGNRDFEAAGIRYYLPGSYGNRHLVPQGINVMLETRVDHGEDLEPYVVWYTGTRRIGEGFIQNGTARLIWKAPRQTGFHTIRAELFPFEPQTMSRGVERQLSLPVSSDVKENVPSIRDGDFLYRYGLAGDLLEAGTGPELVRKNPATREPRWHPVEQIYGLVLEEGDVYEVPPRSLDFSALAGDKDGLLRFFIRFFPQDEGTIFGTRLDQGLESVFLRLFLAEKALYLELKTGNETSLSKALELDGTESSFLGIVVDLEIRETGIRAFLEAADSPLPPPHLRLPPETGERAEFPFLRPETSAKGELRSWLGTARTVGNPAPASDSPSSPTAVVDDFSALFRLFDRAREMPPPVEETAPADSTGSG
jgi:hypothetical protein